MNTYRICKKISVQKFQFGFFWFYFPRCHVLDRMFWQDRKGQYLFLSAAGCLSIFMLPKQSSAQQKQMEGKFWERWDFKTPICYQAALFPHSHGNKNLLGICRQQKSMAPLLLGLPVSVWENGFRILLPFDKGDKPSYFFSMPFCPPFLYWFW